MIEKRIFLNEKTAPVAIDVVQGTVGQPIRFIIADEKLEDGTEARAYIEKPSGHTVYQAAELTDKNVITLIPNTQTFIEAGTAKMTIQLIYDESILYSFVIFANVQKNPAMNEGGTESTNYDYFLKGDKGDPGEDGHSPIITASKQGKTTTIYSDGETLATIIDGSDGEDGDDGVGIASIYKTGSSGLDPVIDEYTILFTDNTTTTFSITNGKKGSPGEDGHSPVITASKTGATTTIYSDGVAVATINDGTNGNDGHSPIITASKSGTTTTIYSDGTAIATVNDGADGQDGDDYVLTNQDKTDIANEVIGMLPTWAGGNY